MAKQHRCKIVCKSFGRVIFSTLGLTVLLAGYLVGGAYMFRSIEEVPKSNFINGTMQIYELVERFRHTMVVKMRSLVAECSVHICDGQDRKIIQKWLEDYQNFTIKVIREGYYTGQPPSINTGWRLPSALMFTASILTTIGYGHVVPITETGKMVVIIYAIFAIPLMTMWLHKIVNYMRKGAIFIWTRLTCFNCNHIRNAAFQRRILKSKAVGTNRINWDESFESEDDSDDVVETENDTAPLLIPDRKKLITYGEKHESVNSKTEFPLTVTLVIIVAYILMAASLFQRISNRDQRYPQWTFLQSVYYCYISVATLGFGDFVPGYMTGNKAEFQPEELRLLVAIPFVIFGLALLLMCGQLMSDTIINRMKQSQLMKKVASWSYNTPQSTGNNKA